MIQSGAALSIFDGNAGSFYGNFNNRAQATGSNPLTQGWLFSRVVGTGRYLDATAFTRALRRHLERVSQIRISATAA